MIYERFDCSLGTGLGKVKGRMFRIGHLGDCNDLTLMAALAGCEMGLKLSGVKLAGSGVQAAMDYLRLRTRRRHCAGCQKAACTGIPITNRRQTMQRRTFVTGVTATAATLAAPMLRAQTTCPPGRCASSSGFAPGGGTDILARVIGQKLGDMWNTQVIVENKAGASGTIAADYVAKQPGRRHHAAHGAHQQPGDRARRCMKLNYDAEKDFQPIVLVGVTPNLLICNEQQPAKTVKDIVELCRKPIRAR